MQITDLWIRNFKSIRSMHIENIENALILVGQNNTGKTVVLDALRAVIGNYEIGEEDFLEDYPNIEIRVSLKIQEEDLKRFHKNGLVSTYRRYESWFRDFSRSFLLIKKEYFVFPILQIERAKCVIQMECRKIILIFPESFPECII